MTLILYYYIEVSIIFIQYDLSSTLLYDSILYKYDSPW